MLRRVRESGFANQDQRRSRSQRAVGAAKKTISGLNPTTAKMALRPSSPTVLLFAAVARTYFGLFCFSTEKTFLYNFGVRQWEPPIATAWLCSLLAPWMHLNNHALWKKRRKKNDLLAATDCTNFATNQTKRPRNPLILRGETWRSLAAQWQPDCSILIEPCACVRPSRGSRMGRIPNSGQINRISSAGHFAVANC